MSETSTSNAIENEQAKAGFYFEFGSSIQNIDEAVNTCMSEIRLLFSDREISESESHKIDYALRELLVNAVVYGNLQFTKSPSETLTVGERQERIETLEKEHPERTALPVKVFLAKKGDILVIRIIDQGRGFERTEVLDPVKDEHLFNQTGRGLKLAEEFLGQISYKKTPEGFEARVEKEMVKTQSESKI